jgi:FAD/FMN-containing dehydrogenase
MKAMAEDLRLFRSFLDPIDMVMCCTADTSLAEINEQAGIHGLRFPLVGDPSSSLQSHLAAIDHAPPSARFGAYVDNVLGMNWELASSRLVRIGERVIKSTTGYDLLRFLLHSDGRYGRARDYVLRLRPRGGSTVRGVFCGENETIDRVRTLLLHSPWIHWLDAVNLYVSPTDGSVLEVEADCANGEPAIFAQYFAKIGRETGAAVSARPESRYAGLPTLSLKTTVVTAPQVARRLVRDHGGSACVLCVNGVVHYFPTPNQRPLPPAAIEELSTHCARAGGHIMGSWAGNTGSCDQEVAWAEELKAAWNQL